MTHVPDCIDEVAIKEYDRLVIYERDGESWRVKEKHVYEGCLSPKHALLTEHLRRTREEHG